MRECDHEFRLLNPGESTVQFYCIHCIFVLLDVQEIEAWRQGEGYDVGDGE